MSEAVLATFSEVKFIKTRSTMQLILEVPIDQADEALRLLGGVPQPAEERWVGVARAPKERKEDKKKERRKFSEMPLSQQAALRCKDPEFQDFMSIEYGDTMPTANAVREHCGDIDSRSELDTNDIAAAKWKKLESDFQDYLTTQRYGAGLK